MGGNGNGNDLMLVGREWEQESHSRTPLMWTNPQRDGRPAEYRWRRNHRGLRGVIACSSHTPPH